MNSGEIGIISAVVTVITLLINKLVEVLITRIKANSAVRLKSSEFSLQQYGDLKAELKEEISKLRYEIDALRDENISLQVEKARLEIISEHLRSEVERLIEAQARLQAELLSIRNN